MEWIAPFLALTAMEIVLGIDNIVFIAILAARLPVEQREKARIVGLSVALGTRLLLLFSIKWIMQAETPLFGWTDLGIPRTWFPGDEHAFEEINFISIKDLILLGGGLFLITKSVKEIHAKVEGLHEGHEIKEDVTFGSVITQIALLDIVFSLDSVITAVGMVKNIWVMVAAVIVAIGVMIAFSGKITAFVDRHPTIKILALSFLILIGVLLIAQGIGTHFSKGYVYFAMAFSLGVEFLNMRMRRRRLRPTSGPGTANPHPPSESVQA